MSDDVGYPCPACGDPHARVGQSRFGGVLRWYCSTDCPRTGRSEEDGWGFPDEEVREAIIDAHGYWMVSSSGDPVRVLKVVKDALGLDRPEVEALKSSLPAVYFGTRVEAEWLCDLLCAAGATAQVELIEQ